MTLIFGTTIGFACGLVLGRRRLAFVIVGLVWYAALATQTAHLAHPGRDGFFGVDGLGAGQGRHLGQYWLGQVPILCLGAAMVLAGDRLRRRAGGGRRPSPQDPPKAVAAQR
jgi:hypothetical protein